MYMELWPSVGLPALLLSVLLASLAGASAAAPCTSSTPCNPQHSWYYCTAGSAANGCRDLYSGPFPVGSCSAQCTSASNTEATPGPTITPTPFPSSTSSPSTSMTLHSNRDRIFRVFNKCPSSVWVAALSNPMPTLESGSWEVLPGAAPLVLTVPAFASSGRLWGRTGCSTSVTFPVCTLPVPCGPESDFAYCQAGPSVGGCKLFADGPFPAWACTQQCVSPANEVPAGTQYSAPSFTCATGDCDGKVVCELSGNGPVTLFEWTFTDGQDYYDISAVDGYNVAMTAAPTGPYVKRPNQDCYAPSCKMDTTACPPELQMDVPGTTAKSCMSICAAVHSASQRAQHTILQDMYTGMTASGKMMRDLVCCACGDTATGGCKSPTCSYGCSPYVDTYPSLYASRTCHVEEWPLASDGQSYIKVFKMQCPDAYSWQFDDLAGTHFCTIADYDITLCG